MKKKLEEYNFQVSMPTLEGKGKQLSTDESNESRFVPKIHWEDESVQVVLKQKYNLSDHKIDKKLIP